MSNQKKTWDDVLQIVINALDKWKILYHPQDSSSLSTCFADVDAADTAYPPPTGPRIDNFIKQLINDLGYPIDLAPHELKTGTYYPQVHDLVQFLFDEQP